MDEHRYAYLFCNKWSIFALWKALCSFSCFFLLLERSFLNLQMHLFAFIYLLYYKQPPNKQICNATCQVLALVCTFSPFSRWPESYPTEPRILLQWLQKLVKELVPPFGISTSINCGRRSYLVNSIFSELEHCKLICGFIMCFFYLQTSGLMDKPKKILKKQKF